jgi:hypothetical protein
LGGKKLSEKKLSMRKSFLSVSREISFKICIERERESFLESFSPVFANFETSDFEFQKTWIREAFLIFF